MGESVRRLFLIDADSCRFDNPKLPFDGVVLQGGGQCLDESQEVGVGWAGREAEHGDAGILARQEDEGIGKIEIERNEAAAFRAAALNQSAIFIAGERLLDDGADIMTCGDEDGFAAQAEVLVELEFHAADSSGTLT